MMSTVQVLNLNDSGTGSLRQAIADANAADTIDLNGLAGTITLTTPLSINKDLTIDGPGARQLTLSGNNHSTRAITIESEYDVTINDLTIAEAGTAGEYGGGIYAKSARNSYRLGDEVSYKTLTLLRVRMTDNLATSFGGGVMAKYVNITLADCTFDNNLVKSSAGYAVGGGLYTDGGRLTISGSTFSSNRAVATVGTQASQDAVGGGVYFTGPNVTAAISNSTFTGNSTLAGGGTSYNNATGGAMYLGESTNGFGLDHVTITGNSVAISSGTRTQCAGGGILTSVTHPSVITNSIIAGNSAATEADLLASTAVTASYSLIGDGSGSRQTQGTNHNLVGTTAVPIDPKLAALADNGGGTWTRALLRDSPAIDVGQVNASSVDQRGVARVGVPDLGAYEFVPNNVPQYVGTPGTAVTVGQTYRYDLAATDADSEPLSFTASTLPAWLTLTDHHDGTATLTGTPAAGDVGNVSITLSVTDGEDTTPQAFTLHVAAAPAAPVFTSTAPADARDGVAFLYTLTATDANDDALTFAATSIPAWMTLTDNSDGTATLSGTPGVNDVAVTTAEWTVTDGTTIVTQSFALIVQPALAPLFGGGADPSPENVLTDNEKNLTVRAIMKVACAAGRWQ